MGSGEAVVRGTEQHGRELIPDGQNELQVGNGLLGPAPVRRQHGQGQSSEVLRQAKVGGGSLVQLAQGGIHVLAEQCLEEPGERERQRLSWLRFGKTREGAIPLGIGAGTSEPGGQGHRSSPVGAGPAGGCLE